MGICKSIYTIHLFHEKVFIELLLYATLLSTKDVVNKTDEIQLTSWRLRMGLVSINSSSNTIYQVVRILVENDRAGEGGQAEGSSYYFISTVFARQ